MKSNFSIRCCVVGFLILLMSIPLSLASNVVKERAELARETRDTLSQEWGGAQALNGPYLEIPVTAKEVRTEERPLRNANGTVQRNVKGDILYEPIETTEIVTRNSVFVLADMFLLDIASKSEARKRGLFSVPVYRADAALEFHFQFEDLDAGLLKDETLNWSESKIHLGLKTNRSLRKSVEIKADDAAVQMQPRAKSAGLIAEIGDPRAIDKFELDLHFLGALKLAAVPAGRISNITMTSDWPHPSFVGSFLPDTREITEEGFQASWSIPFQARAIPSVGRENPETGLAQSSGFGVTFYQPNDFYQQAYRLGRYGILLIGLTFLSILLIERRSQSPLHPVQYCLLGVAQSLFVVMMVALAEQLGFGLAYLLVSAAEIVLIASYMVLGRGLPKTIGALIAGVLILAYGIVFMILKSSDYALLAGSLLSFAAVTVAIFMTKDEDFKTGMRLPKRKRKAVATA